MMQKPSGTEVVLWFKVEKDEWVGMITHVIIKWHNVEKHDINEG